MIIVHRRPLDQKIPEDLQELGIQKYGSFLLNGTTARILEGEEEKKIMSIVLGMDPDEKEFRKKCEEYYANCEADVPLNGLKLNISLKKDGIPENPIHYIQYKLALISPVVAPSREQVEFSKKYKFFLEDTDAIERKEREKTQTVKKAMKVFVNMTDDVIKEMILERMYEGTTDGIDPADYDKHLEKLVVAEPDKFIKLADDKDLIVQGTVVKMLKFSVLRQVGLAIFMNDDTKIADTFDDAITFFKDKSKANLISKLQAQLGEKMNKR